MKNKTFKELTYDEKVIFLEKEFGITEVNLHNIEEVIRQCYNLGYINNDLFDSYEAIQDFSLEIAVRIYTIYDNLKEAYVDCTSTSSALSDLKMIYTTLNDPDFKKDLENLIDKYEKKE